MEANELKKLEIWFIKRSVVDEWACSVDTTTTGDLPRQRKTFEVEDTNKQIN